ncbi:MAG: hypothetical protein ABIO37_12650 [Caulobacteraceae bacterium]
MQGAQVHYELFIRRQPNAPWTLAQAGEDRAKIVQNAEEMLAEGRAAAVKVTKETLDPETRGFRTVTVMSKGQVEATKAAKERPTDDTLPCITPADLYTVHARERIGRLMENYLTRKHVTAFELLHRPDLVEELDSSGIEIQHAVQKVAIPEAQAKGVVVHEVIRTFQKLIERAVERLEKDGRRGAFPNVVGPAFAEAAQRLDDDPERNYYLGGGIAAALAPANTWDKKVSLILDLAENAPSVGRPRAHALALLEQPLAEILGSRVGLAELLGPDLDLGASLAALVRLGASAEVNALVAYDPNLEKQLPRLEGPAARLAEWMTREAFEDTRAAVMRRVLAELGGPRRLRPSDPEGEISLLRALAMALTAAGGKNLSLEDVQAAFAARSRTLVASDFVDALLADRETPLAEAEALTHLATNVLGAANKRAAARWIDATLTSLKFEKEVRFGPDSPVAKLVQLAGLQRGVKAAGLNETDQLQLAERIGDIGGLIEADAKLTAMVSKAAAPAGHRLTLLLRLACGETAPMGPATDRARTEALKLARGADVRTELASSPGSLERLKSLMNATGEAA